MSKDRKINIAIIVSFLTIIGAVITGGISFGALQEGLRSQDEKVRVVQFRTEEYARQIYKINTKLTEVATDLRWIRINLEEYNSKHLSD